MGMGVTRKFLCHRSNREGESQGLSLSERLIMQTSRAQGRERDFGFIWPYENK